MPCDRGFGNLEIEYRKHKLHDPQDFLAAASKLRNAEVKTLCAEDMLDLKKLAQDHFKHNKAKNCLFSQCKRVFLSKKYPLEMVLEYYNKVKRCFDTESVFLSVDESVISKQTTTQDFQTYYLDQSGKTGTELQDLLPRLRETKFQAILPKKFKDGQVMFINRDKLKDLVALSAFTLGKATQWIEGVFARQQLPNLRPKSNQRKEDDGIYFHIENKEDEMDLDIDPQGAIVMDEDYHEQHTEDGGEEIVPETCETGKKSHKRKGSKGKKQADTGNIIINLFITI